MQGYLYNINILSEEYEELYWSPIEINEDVLREEYRAFEIDIFSDEKGFEEWWNEKNKNFYIERVFLDNIYV
jgi:hypothetical protein